MEFHEKTALMEQINEYAAAREKYQRAFQRWLNDPCDEQKTREYREAEEIRNSAIDKMFDYVYEKL